MSLALQRGKENRMDFVLGHRLLEFVYMGVYVIGGRIDLLRGYMELTSFQEGKLYQWNLDFPGLGHKYFSLGLVAFTVLRKEEHWRICFKPCSSHFHKSHLRSE